MKIYKAAQSTEQAYTHNVHRDRKCYQKQNKKLQGLLGTATAVSVKMA